MGEIWAYMNFLEVRVDDLKEEVVSADQSSAAAIALSVKSIEQSEQLLVVVGKLEDKNKELILDNQERYSTMEVVIITTLTALAGVSAGIIVGYLAK